MDITESSQPSTPITPLVVDSWIGWFEKLASFFDLEKGWNGYSANPPNDAALQNARLFLQAMQEENCEPTRLAPSAMEGVAITRRVGNRKVFVECYNDGRAYALFSERGAEMRVQSLQLDAAFLASFMKQMRDYLNG